MKRRLFTLAAALSLLLCAFDVFVIWRSWLVRDEISFARGNKFVVASDCGRTEFAFSNCLIGTETPMGPYAIGLIPGSPTVYSKRFQARWKSTLPGGDFHMTLNHVGVESLTYNSYGSRPLVNNVFAVTIPGIVPFCIFAVLPAVWLWKKVSLEE